MVIRQRNLIRESAEYAHVFRGGSPSAGGVRMFLSHSHKDHEMAKGLAVLLSRMKISLYIDWMDEAMPESPDEETARRIKNKIGGCHLFLFLATANSKASRWCPWEIGYADGVKPLDRVVVIPTEDDHGTTHGNEYLKLYRRFDLSAEGHLVTRSPGQLQTSLFEDYARRCI